jgi:antitoxin (DNA-binding transcriptional repressor) of toxin-antitoxin stability system
MKMGIKEFRERIREVAEGGEPVVVTNHGKPVGSFAPLSRKDPAAVRRAEAEIAAWQDDMRAKGIDLEKVLAGLGLDPWGEPILVPDR